MGSDDSAPRWEGGERFRAFLASVTSPRTKRPLLVAWSKGHESKHARSWRCKLVPGQFVVNYECQSECEVALGSRPKREPERRIRGITRAPARQARRSAWCWSSRPDAAKATPCELRFAWHARRGRLSRLHDVLNGWSAARMVSERPMS